MEDGLTGAQRVGRMIRDARMEKGWSQEELARRAGKSQSWIWKIEHGRMEVPRQDALGGVAKALGIDQAILWIEAGLADTARSAIAAAEATLRSDGRFDQIMRLLPDLPDEGIEPVAHMIRYYVGRGGEAAREAAAKERTRRRKRSIAD